jgi:hypothetical protein
VISKKFFFIDFLDELGLFIEEKPIFPSLCRLPWFHGCPNENFVRPIFERCFQVKDFSFSFWKTEGIGLTGVIFYFWPQKQIPYEFLAPFWNIANFDVFGLDLM